MTYQHLVETLHAVGKAIETWLSPDGTRVLLLPYAGRVLGVFAPADDENFYWTRHSLASVDTAIGPGTGREGCEDVSQVWAFRGTTEEIRAVAHTLLSPEI